jgi:hypothetical protein
MQAHKKAEPNKNTKEKQSELLQRAKFQNYLKHQRGYNLPLKLPIIDQNACSRYVDIQIVVLLRSFP